MPPWTRTRLCLKLLSRGRRNFALAEDPVIGKQTAAADAEFRIALRSAHAMNELDAGPNAAGVLPPSAASSQPFAENGARRDQAPIAPPCRR